MWWCACACVVKPQNQRNDWNQCLWYETWCLQGEVSYIRVKEDYGGGGSGGRGSGGGRSRSRSYSPRRRGSPTYSPVRRSFSRSRSRSRSRSYNWASSVPVAVLPTWRSTDKAVDREMIGVRLPQLVQFAFLSCGAIEQFQIWSDSHLSTVNIPRDRCQRLTGENIKLTLFYYWAKFHRNL